MSRYVCWTIIGVIALLALNMGQIQADETKSYRVGTKLLFREYNVPVTIVPHGPREIGLPPSFDWAPSSKTLLDEILPARHVTKVTVAVAGLLPRWLVWKPGLTPPMIFHGSTSPRRSW